MIGTYHPNHSAEEMLDMVLVITAALERQLEYANTTEDQQDAWI
ncbi:MAG: hypothetical protein U9Q15_03760 [Patescibacteria group bacterium]|nr:hypothetical protein [Patescibacteria group bacterium]